jgi:hypothetical protein
MIATPSSYVIYNRRGTVNSEWWRSFLLCRVVSARDKCALFTGSAINSKMMVITVAAFLVVVFMGKASHGARTNACDTHPTFVRYVKYVDV